MQFQQLLEFESKDDLPQEFFCKICYDICNCPALKSEYIEEEIYCNDNFHNLNSELSSHLQNQIIFKCDLCGKAIKYLRYRNHYEKCQYLIKEGKLIQNSFLQIQINEEQLFCQICNNIPYKPQEKDGGIICLFCRQQNPGQAFKEIQAKLKNPYLKIGLKCKQCNSNIVIDQLLIHFKKCFKNSQYFTQTEEGQTIQDKKNLRQKIKQTLQVVDLSIDKMIQIHYETGSSEYQISFQMKLVNNISKNVSKLEERLKRVQNE